MDEQEDDIQDIPEAVAAEDTLQPSQHPPEAQPDDTQSLETGPLESQPNNILSANAQNEEILPIENQAADHAHAAENLPAATRLEVTEPPETEPLRSQPAEIHLEVTKPLRPAPTEPQDIQSLPTEPPQAAAAPARPEDIQLEITRPLPPLQAPLAEIPSAQVQSLEAPRAEVQPEDSQSRQAQPAEVLPAEVQSPQTQPAEPVENQLEESQPAQPLQMSSEDVQLEVTLPLSPRQTPPADIQTEITLPRRPLLPTPPEEAQPAVAQADYAAQTEPEYTIQPEFFLSREAPPAEAQPMEVQPLEYWESTSPQSYRPVLEERGFFPFVRKSSRPVDQQRRRKRRVIMLLVTLAVLVVLLVPSLFAVMTALQDYSSLKSLGLSGVHHLLLAKDDLTGTGGSTSSSSSASCSTATPTVAPTATTATSGTSSTGSGSVSLSSLPDASQLQSAQTELKGAQTDFKALQARMNHPDWILGTAGDIPGFHSQLSTAKALANTGYDVSTMGIELLQAASPLLTRLHGHSLTGGNLVTQTDINALQHATGDSLSLLANVQVQLTQININDLPVCAAEKAEFSKLAGELPRAQHMLTQASSLIQPIGWLLGVSQPRHFLVQTLDDTELRPTGGFAGEFGIATIQNSKLQPLILYNVDLIDYRSPAHGGFTNNWNLDNTDGKPFGRPAPATYSWWPIANWGLRDSNLTADFPTDAKLVMGVFKAESTDPALVSQGSQQLDGIINITPAAIAHVLNVTGPLYVPGYDVNVTGDNLETLIHYYQLDPAGLAKNLQVFPNDGTEANARKRFVQTVAHLLESRVFQLPLKGLEAVAKQAFTDMQSHDISVYVTNPQIEKLLVDHQAAGAISTTPGLDSFMVVHTNWSAGKINGHVKVNQVDDVTLDNKGGATHHLSISINDYYAPNPTRDFTTYWDYVRVYAPPSAKLLSADGFGSNSNPLCVMPHCPADPYPNGELVCPDGNYNPGPRTNTRLGNDRDPPLYAPGGPTSTTSDVPGRTMWAGNVMVPMGCTATITLSWYVPGVASTSSSPVAAGSAPYALLVQREGGTFYGLQVILHPASKVQAEGTKTVRYTVTSSTDYTFTFGQPPQLPPPFSLP
jgi:hypothetical protein